MGNYNKKLPCHWNVDLSPRLWHKLIFICIFVFNVFTSIRVLISKFPRITRSGERQRELWWLGGDYTFSYVRIFILCSILFRARGPIRLSLPGGETGDPQRDAQGDQQGKAGDHWWWGLFEENPFPSYITFSIFFRFSDSIGAFAQIDLNQVPS